GSRAGRSPRAARIACPRARVSGALARHVARRLVRTRFGRDSAARGRNLRAVRAGSRGMKKLAIHELLESSPDSAKIDAWMEGKRFPLVEGPSATFVWRGEADRVDLRHFIYGLESAQPLTRVPGTDFWYHVLEIPPRSRV